MATLVKLGLLTTALALGAANLLRTKPRLLAAREQEQGSSASGLLRRLISGEIVIVTGAVFTAAVLSSLAPPPAAFALQNSALAQVGPGRIVQTVRRAGYTLQVLSRRTGPPPRTRSRCGSPAAACPSAARP